MTINNLKIWSENINPKYHFRNISVKTPRGAILASMGPLNELKARRSMSSQQEKQRQGVQVVKLHDKKGMGWTAIARQLGLKNESSVRSIYERAKAPKKTLNEQVADRLEKILKEKGGYLDISTGTELGYPWSEDAPRTGISASQLRVASIMLREKGYSIQVIF